VGIKRVWRSFHRLKVNLEASALGCFDNGSIGPHRAFFAAELGFEILAPVHSRLGHRRVQLKWMPLNRKGMIRALLKSAVKVGFADVAPRANRVGDNIKFDHETAFRFLSICVSPKAKPKWRDLF
jgi:hypothetical protein